MAWSFGDGFDLYAAQADMTNGYWDSTGGAISFTAGRFSGSRAINWAAASQFMTKSSGVNDAAHHFTVAFQQTTAIGGTSGGTYLALYDGATSQCVIWFRQDGAILLSSGTAGGTVLATYTGAFPIINTWYQFEFEVVINNTTGSFKVRKNGNNVDDHSTTGINTRGGTANNYANKLTVGCVTSTPSAVVDDLFWRSDASSVAWLGDIRCYTRMPASDAAVTFSKSPPILTEVGNVSSNTSNQTNNTSSYYWQVIPSRTGTIGSITAKLNAGATGNLKCTAFNDSANLPVSVITSATTLVNPVIGFNTFTFPTPFAVTVGVPIWIGWQSDVAVDFLCYSGGGGLAKYNNSVAYSTFPPASPVIQGGTFAPLATWSITMQNFSLVNEPQQDAATTYVYSITPGDADFYGVASIASTPSTVIACTVRSYAQKSDVGTRTGAVQIKSGSTTVASPTLTLTTSGWQWAWRTDTTDPNTGSAWSATAVNNVQIGSKTVA